MTPHIPYARQWIDDGDIAAVSQVLRGEYLTQGPAVDRFEAAFAQEIGAPYAVAVNSGTAALHLAALAAGLGAGDAAIVPALTFAATANAIIYTGAKPIFADIDQATLGLCASSTERAIARAKSLGLKPKAIFPVHYAGLPVSRSGLVELATHHSLVIIEDACHALGAQVRTGDDGLMRPIGSPSAFGHMQTWSFHPAKHITTGEGGAVSTANGEWAEILRKLRSHGITKDPQAYRNRHRSVSKRGEPNPWYHEMQMLGLNYRMPDVLAALGTSQLSRAGSFLSRRRAIARRYHQELADVPCLSVPPGDRDDSRHAYHLYSLRIDFPRLGKTRAMVMNELREFGIGTQVHYIPVHWHPFYESNPSLWSSVETPVAESYYEQELSIPMYPNMSEDDVGRVVAALRKVVDG